MNYTGPKKIIYTIDDWCWSFQWLAVNNPASIWEEPHLAELKLHHETYGSCWQLNVDTTGSNYSVGKSLADVPVNAAWQAEWQAAASWLCYNHHNYDLTADSHINQYNRYVVNRNEIIRITGGTANWRGNFIVLHYLLANQTDCVRTRDDFGLKVMAGWPLFSSNGDNASYANYLTGTKYTTQKAVAGVDNFWRDTDTNLYFIRPNLYLDEQYWQFTVPDVINGLSAAHKNLLLFITHEYFRFVTPVNTGRVAWMNAVGQYALDNGYINGFLTAADLPLEYNATSRIGARQVTLSASGTGPRMGGYRLDRVDSTDPNADRIRCVRGGVVKRLRRV